jgi:hypothetical protein
MQRCCASRCERWATNLLNVFLRLRVRRSPFAGLPVRGLGICQPGNSIVVGGLGS